MGSGSGAKNGQIVGYKYFLSMDFAWCHGFADRLNKLYTNDEPLKNTAISVDGETVQVDEPEFFGEYEGGVRGTVKLLKGAETQTADSYLEGVLGANEVPAYRGVTRTLLYGSTANDRSRAFYVGNNPYLKPWTAQLQRIYKRIVDGAVTDQWQSSIAGVPLIDSDLQLIDVKINSQHIFINVDLSSEANGFTGDNGTITGGGQIFDSVKSKVINTLMLIRDSSVVQDESRDFLGKEGTGSNISVGVGYFRFTDGAQNNTSANPNNIDESEAPIPTDSEKINDTYDSTYNLPARGWQMKEDATKEDIDDLIQFVNTFSVVPDNAASNSFQGMSQNVTEAYATISDTSLIRSHLLFSPLISDDTNITFSTYTDDIRNVLDDGTGEPITVVFHWGYSTSSTQEDFSSLLRKPVTFSLDNIGGGWYIIANDGFDPEYMNTLAPGGYTVGDRALVDLPSGDAADTPFSTPPDNHLTWYFGPLLTSGIYAGRFDVQTHLQRDEGGATTITIDYPDLTTRDWEQSDVDISGDDTAVIGDGENDDTLRRIFGGDFLYMNRTFSEVVEMNPVHIIRECLTDQNWGLGLASAEIDETTFAAAAQTCYDERLGISLAWFRSEPIEDFIQLVLNHIDAVLYVDRGDGTWHIKLIRDDYDPGSLTTYTDVDVVEWESISIKSPAELVNSVTLEYNDRARRQEASLTVYNLAQVKQLGSVINTTVIYPGIYQKTLATRLAQRDLTTLSTALISGVITLTRDAYQINPGDVFKLSSSRYNLSGEIMRVIEIEFGDGIQNGIKVTFTQDKFNLSTSTDEDLVIVPDSEFTDVSTFPQPVDDRVVIEEPHYFFARRVGDTDAATRETDDQDLGYLTATGIEPSPDSIYARMYTNDGGGYEEDSITNFCPYATLNGELREQADATTVTLSGFTYYTDLAVNDLLLIDNEFMKIVSIDSTTQITVGRGCLDTVPAYHKDGSKVFFVEGYLATAREVYTASDSIDVRLLTTTAKGRLDIAVAPTDTVTMASRITRPYPVGKLQLDGSYTGVWDTSSGATVDATWVHRDRLLQTGDNPTIHTDASIGPETNSDYTISAVAYDLNGDEITSIGDLFSVDKNQTLTHTISMDAYSPTSEGTVPWSAVGVRVSNTRQDATSLSYTNWQTPEVMSWYPVTPSELGTNFEGFWVDANIIGSLSQNADGSTPVVYDGDPVGKMENQI